MDTKHIDIANEARAFCKAHKIKLSTLGLRALGNGRFFDRFERRRKSDDEAVDKLRAFMADNLPDQNEGRPS